MRYPEILRWFWMFVFLRIGKGCVVSVGGQTYDLCSLEKAGKDGIVTVSPPESEHGYKYEASFFSDLISCQNTMGNFVRLRAKNMNSCWGVYGTWSTATNTKTTNGFDVSFKSTNKCGGDFNENYSSTFKFLCDVSAGALGTMQAEQDGDNNCSYSVSIYTNLVCAGSTPVPNPTPGGPTPSPADHTGSISAGGLSGGSIFLIALVSALFIYIMLGVSLNYKKEQSYKTPHREFWCSKLPFWTKIGCITSCIWTLWCSQRTYSWCCTHVCKRQKGDTTTSCLIDGEDSS